MAKPYNQHMKPKAFGAFIRTIRESMGLNRPQFVERFKMDGLNDKTLNNYEGGFTSPSTGMLEYFGRVLGVRPGVLMDLLAGVITVEEALAIRQKENFSKSSLASILETLTDQERIQVEEFAEFVLSRRANVPRLANLPRPINETLALPSNQSLTPTTIEEMTEALDKAHPVPGIVQDDEVELPKPKSRKRNRTA